MLKIGTKIRIEEEEEEEEEGMVSGQVFRLVRKRNGRIVVITGF